MASNATENSFLNFIQASTSLDMFRNLSTSIYSNFNTNYVSSLSDAYMLSKIGPLMHPDSKVHGTNMEPIWVLLAPDGSHVGPMKLAIMWFR